VEAFNGYETECYSSTMAEVPSSTTGPKHTPTKRPPKSKGNKSKGHTDTTSCTNTETDTQTVSILNNNTNTNSKPKPYTSTPESESPCEQTSSSSNPSANMTSMEMNTTPEMTVPTGTVTDTAFTDETSTVIETATITETIPCSECSEASSSITKYISTTVYASGNYTISMTTPANESSQTESGSPGPECTDKKTPPAPKHPSSVANVTKPSLSPTECDSMTTSSTSDAQYYRRRYEPVQLRNVNRMLR